VSSDNGGAAANQLASFSVTGRRAPLEEQADRYAEEVLQAPLQGPGASLRAPRAFARPSWTDAPDASRVHGSLGAGGRGLDAAVRADMEARFHADFSRVRVHLDARADQVAADLGALAFTSGSAIGFRSGQYAPATTAGRRLLAHELTHVLQQGGGPPVVQCQEAPRPPGVQRQFAVHIEKAISVDQLLVEFIKQYRKVKTDAEAVALRDKEAWRWTSPPKITEADLHKGYVLLNVTDRSIAPSTQEERDARKADFDTLPASERGAIDAATDQKFWDQTNYKVGQKLGTTGDDKELAKDWMLVRDQLLRDRQAIEALPPQLKAFLFSETATTTVRPEDYQTVLRIAQKLSDMTPAELAEYKSRTNTTTSDLGVFEGAIDRYRAERQARAEITEERAKVSTKLAALDDVYRQYRAYKSSLTRSARLGMSGTSMGVGAGLGSIPEQNRERQDLTDKLQRHGFQGITDFENWIHRYEAAFQKESLALATVMLDQYEHTLVEQENRYKTPSASASLYQQMAPARQAYKDADQAHQDWLGAGGSTIIMSPADMGLAAHYTGIRNQARARGDAAVRAAGGSDPLVTGRDFDREALARTPKAGVQGFMLDYIRARRKDIADTRKNITAAPDMVFMLDDLRAAAYRAQKIAPDSIFDMIVKDHISDLHWQKAIPHIVLAVIAVAAGLVSGGSGAVAVLGAATAFGISSYQALETYHQYEVNHAAHGAKLLSEDPSFAWVVVAVVGAGLDLAVVGATIAKFASAIEVFNASKATATDVAKLSEAMAGAEEKVRQAVVRAAAAEAEAKEAWAAARSTTNAVLPGLSGLALSLAAKYAYPIFLSVKRLGRDFQLFLRSREFLQIVGDVSKLAPEELAALKSLFEKVVEDWGKIAKYGEKLGMTESEATAFMKMHVESPTTTLDDVAQQMDLWKAARGDAQQAVESGGKLGKPFGFADPEQFAKFRATADAALKKAMRRIDPKAEAYLQGSSLSGVSFKRKVPFDAASDFDVAVTSRELMKKAEKLGLELKSSPRHIGPLEYPRDEAVLRELGLHDVRKKLAALLEAEGGSGREINFMLFDNLEAATKPIGGGAAGEAVRPVIPLKGD
jgi:hypothetical protein